MTATPRPDADSPPESDSGARLRAEFLSCISHELRTPLHAILGFAQLLRQAARHGSAADTLRAIGHIESAGAQLLGLVDDFLDLSSLDTDRLRLRSEAVDLARLVRRCLDQVASFAAERGVTMDLRVEPGLATARADRRAARQIVFNLLAAAIESSLPGARVGLRLHAQGGDLVLEVSDRGPAPGAGRLPTLFEPFAASPPRRAAAGHALGLPVSQRLAHAMAGRIEAQAGDLQGCVFTWRVPVDGTAETGPDSGFGNLAGGLPAGRLAGADVLYIEDEPVNVLLMQAFFDALPDHALRLHVATTGAAGISCAREGLPDLILLDMHLPDIDGHAVLRHLRADPATARIPVIAVTADALPEQVDRAIGAGCEAHWAKPLDFGRVRDDLDRRFARRDG